MAQASLDKDQRRSFRDEALRGLNSIATEVAIDRVSTRAGSDVVQKFFKKLCAQVTADSLEALRAERTQVFSAGVQRVWSTLGMHLLTEICGELVQFIKIMEFAGTCIFLNL